MMAVQASDSAPYQVKARPQGESAHYASNFRSFLTGLVILHHTAVSYGGEGSHLFRSTHHPPGSSVALVGFNAVNQSFFMGSFFFLAGHYSKKSLQRRSRGGFIKGRLYRLALPTLAYSIVAPPLCQVIVQFAHGQIPNWVIFASHLKSIRGVRGPVWFTAVLLSFDIALALLDSRSSSEPRGKATEGHPEKTQTQSFRVGSAIALCSVIDFVWRARFPVNRMFQPLNLNLGYLPQYILSYWFGTRVSSPRDAIPASSSNMRLLAVSMVSGFALVGTFQQKGNAAIKEMLGGFNTASAAYAVWNNATGYLLGNSLLALFAAHCNMGLGWVNALAFPAFLVHIPASVLIQVLADDWKASAITKTSVIGPLNILASWVFGYGASKLWSKAVNMRRTLLNTNN